MLQLFELLCDLLSARYWLRLRLSAFSARLFHRRILDDCVVENVVFLILILHSYFVVHYGNKKMEETEKNEKLL